MTISFLLGKLDASYDFLTIKVMGSNSILDIVLNSACSTKISCLMMMIISIIMILIFHIFNMIGSRSGRRILISCSIGISSRSLISSRVCVVVFQFSIKSNNSSSCSNSSTIIVVGVIYGNNILEIIGSSSSS